MCGELGRLLRERAEPGKPTAGGPVLRRELASVMVLGWLRMRAPGVAARGPLVISNAYVDPTFSLGEDLLLRHAPHQA
jgi:hypothetical protein